MVSRLATNRLFGIWWNCLFHRTHKIWTVCRKGTYWQTQDYRPTKYLCYSMDVEKSNAYIDRYHSMNFFAGIWLRKNTQKQQICCTMGQSTSCHTIRWAWLDSLKHWGRDKMAAISQTTFSSAFSWMKIYEFWFKFHWNFFLRVQLTIFQHCFR